ncbi:MAG: hypothetical protein D8M59_02360 [Planctomycetes bacterium]|nr:hypothetical protein [Planctomycetota bacterium]NOG54438.1 hypothetical protein [Planctomycetota bacterium]
MLAGHTCTTGQRIAGRKKKQPPSGFEPETCRLQINGSESASTETTDTYDGDSDSAQRIAQQSPEKLFADHPELQDLFDGWPVLPEAVRAGIMAMVQASKPE